MIEKLIDKSRIDEVDAVSLLILEAYKNTKLHSDPYLPNMVSSIEAQRVQLTLAINRTKTENQLEHKDEVRDDRLRSLNYLILVFTHHPEAKIKNAAQTLKRIFTSHGLSLTNLNYAAESTLIASLLGDLAQAKLQSSIALLSGCSENITALQLAQIDFENTRIDYQQKKEAEGPLENIKVIKKKVLTLINNSLIVYLRAMEQVDEPTYGSFARQVTSIIDASNKMVKKRNKHVFAK